MHEKCNFMIDNALSACFLIFEMKFNKRGETSEKSKVFQSDAKFVRLHRGALAAATNRHREVTGLPVASRWD